MNAGRCSQVAGRKKITTRLINRVVIIFFMVEIRRIELLTSCMPSPNSRKISSISLICIILIVQIALYVQ